MDLRRAWREGSNGIRDRLEHLGVHVPIPLPLPLVRLKPDTNGASDNVASAFRRTSGVSVVSAFRRTVLFAPLPLTNAGLRLSPNSSPKNRCRRGSLRGRRPPFLQASPAV